jgi:hypothetical protein
MNGEIIALVLACSLTAISLALIATVCVQEWRR